MLASADHPVLVVDLLDRGLRPFRCIPPELWAASEHGCCAYAVPSHGPRPAPLTSACDARRMVRSGRPGPPAESTAVRRAGDDDGGRYPCGTGGMLLTMSIAFSDRTESQ